MLKFIKRLFLLSLILLIGGGVWGYKNGMTKDNYKEFIKERIAKFQKKEKPIQPENKPNVKNKPPKSKNTSKSKKKKVVEYKLQPLPKNPFSSIDRYSRNVPSTATIDVQNLANYLQQKAKTDIEKARAIYIWITDNVRYDDDAYNSGNYPDYTAEYVLQNRKAVCEGYSNLFLELGEEMEIEVEKILGYAKGYGYRKGKKFKESDHAWNAVRINGEWKIIDSTWGSGYGKNVNGRLVSKKKFDNYWFNVDPFEAIFNHLPEDDEFSFIQPSISLSQYEQMPNLDEEYFELGFNGRETFSIVSSNPNSEFPKSYNLKTPVKLISAPKFKNLKINDSHYFEFYIPRGLKVAAITSSNDWIYFEREKGKFTLNFSPKEIGELKICVHHEKSGKLFDTILVYNVNENKESI